MGTSIEFLKMENFRDTYGDIDFLYNDDKEIKERVAKSLYDELIKKGKLEYYKKWDTRPGLGYLVSHILYLLIF